MAEFRGALEANSIGFPVYLFFACLANGAFFYKSAQDFRGLAQTDQNSVAKAGSQLLLSAAIAELIWVVPCFVQCAIYIFIENDNVTGKASCDIQGFYSLVSSVSSMLMAPVLSWFTLSCLIGGSTKYVRYTKLMCGACLAAALILGTIPLLPGARDKIGYAAMGEGFCYWDLSAKPVAGIILVLTILLFIVVILLNCKSLISLSGVTSDRGAKCGTLIVLMVSYLVTWILWPIASLLTLSGTTFPSGMMIAGGALGHAQALVNPVLYGVFWRRHFLIASTDYSAAEAKVKEITVKEMA
jgi:hypothetical protein